MTPPTITARASVNLPGLNAGEIATVDPSDPHIAALLREALLINEDPFVGEVEEPTVSDPGSPEKPQRPETGRDEPQVEPSPPTRSERRTGTAPTRS